MSSIFLLLPLGFFTGVLSGVFGVGGGFVLVPVLALLGWPLALAIGTSLFYVTLISIVGSVSHYREGNLDGPLVLMMALPAMAGALGGALLTERFPAWVLDISFAGLVTVSAFMFQQTEDRAVRLRSALLLKRSVAMGTCVGVLSGLLGVGGGVLLVPGQTRWLHIPLKRAIGNSLFAVVLIGLAGASTHLALGSLNWSAGLVLVFGGLFGLQVGLWMLQRVSSKRLHGWFLAFMIVTAFVMAGHGLYAMPYFAGL